MPSISTRPSRSKVKKRKAARLDKKKETQLIASAHTRRFVVQRGWAPATSDFSKASRKSNPQVDRQIIKFLDKKTAIGGFFGLTGRPSRLVRPRTSSEYSKLKRPGVQQFISRQAQGKLSRVPTPNGSASPAYLIHAPIWDHASETLKALAYVTCIPVGQRLAFTLHLADEIVRRALLSPKGVSGYLQDRIASELRATMNGDKPDFIMGLETTGDGWGPPGQLGLHIHGVIMRCSGTLPSLKAALRRAAGKTEPRKKARLLTVRSALHPLGWTAYIIKHWLLTSQAIKNAQKFIGLRTTSDLVTVLGATANLRKQARGWYNSYRESEDLIFLMRKKGIGPATP